MELLTEVRVEDEPMPYREEVGHEGHSGKSNLIRIFHLGMEINSAHLKPQLMMTRTYIQQA